MEHSRCEYFRTGETYYQKEISEWLKLHSNDEISVQCEYTAIGDNEEYCTSLKTKLGNHYGQSRAICDSELDALLKIEKKLGEIDKDLGVLLKSLPGSKSCPR